MAQKNGCQGELHFSESGKGGDCDVRLCTTSRRPFDSREHSPVQTMSGFKTAWKSITQACHGFAATGNQTYRN